MLRSISWEINIFCHISKQECRSRQQFWSSNVSWWALKGLRRENTWNLIVIGLQPLPLASPGELRLWKPLGNGPRGLRHIWKEWFQEAQALASPHTQKSTKFLNLRYLIFFSSQKYLWHSDYLPSVANFYITWLLPLSPWRSSLRVTWDAVSWAWHPKYTHQIKHNS